MAPHWRAKNCSRYRSHGEVQARREPAVSSAAILTSVGHDVDTVADEGLIGAPDRDVVAAATAAGRTLISLDRGLGDIRAHPPGSHAGVVVLRLTDQSAAAATRAVSDLATLTNPDSLAGAVAVLQRG